MITGVILAHNEEHHMLDCIAALRPHVAEILLIDTESTDRTADVARPLVDQVLSHPNIPNFDAIRNIAIPIARFDWLWFVDADERIPLRTGRLVNDLIQTHGHEFEAINIPFKSYFCGQWMQHCGWWPGYTVCRVLKRGHFEFGHILHSGVKLQGREIRFPADPELAVPHYSFRNLEHYLSKMNRYTNTEALQLNDRGVSYNWKSAIQMMMHDLWEHYEMHKADQDGTLGWILTWMAGQYRWMSHTKLVDLQASEAVSAPKNLEEVLLTMEEELAAVRTLRPELPLGVVLHASNNSTDTDLKELARVASAIAQSDRSVAINGPDLESRLRDAERDWPLLKSLQRVRRARHSIGIVFEPPASATSRRGDIMSALYTQWPSQVEHIPIDWIEQSKRFDEIWVRSPLEKIALRRGGVAPERLRIIEASSDRSQECESMELAFRSFEARVKPPLAPIATASQTRVEWEGELFAGHSFSNINENIIGAFATDDSLAVRVRRVFHNPTYDRSASRAAELLAYINRDLPGAPEITIRHAFPPNWSPPESGLWVHIQPWEYGYLPTNWLPPLRDQVHEIWAPSNYVKRVYINSGVPADKVQVIPWGIDPAVFTSSAPPLRLPTNKSFRFLYVGGTIPRKGFDRLLEAYLAEFKTDEDVCLVIKSVGSQSFYADSNYRDHLLSLAATGRSPQVIYIDDDFTAGQLASLYTSCQCLVAPYRGEGFGLPVLEAMACDVAPMTPQGGATDDFVNDDCGYRLVAAEVDNPTILGVCRTATELDISINEIRRMLRVAFSERERTRSLGINAGRAVRERFTWANTGRQMTDRISILTRKYRKCADVSPARHDLTNHLAVVVLPTGGDYELVDCLSRTCPFVKEILVVSCKLTPRSRQIVAEYGAKIVPEDAEWLQSSSAHEWLLCLNANESIDEDDLEQLQSFLVGAPPEVHAWRLTVRSHDPAELGCLETRLIRRREEGSLTAFDAQSIYQLFAQASPALVLEDVVVQRRKPRSTAALVPVHRNTEITASPMPFSSRLPIRRGRGILIQLATGAHQELLHLTRSHHQEYAASHGLEYLCVETNPAAPKRAGWGKIVLILEAFQQGFERVVWLDADATIVDCSVDLSQLVDAGIGMVQHPNADARSAHWNSGVMAIAHSHETRTFFEAVSAEPENDSPWMEQLAINALAENPSFARLVVRLAPAYNSTPGAVMSKSPVVLAAHGLPFEERKSLMASWLTDAIPQAERTSLAVRTRNDFADLLNCRGLAGEAVEIGVARGDFSRSFLDRWKGGLLHLVDIWRHQSEDDYRDVGNLSDIDHESYLRVVDGNLSQHIGRYRVHRMLSIEAATMFTDGSLDFVYIDANHKYEAVLQDLRNWFPKVRPGGILAGHDYLDGLLPEGEFGVKSAIRAFECEVDHAVRSTAEPIWPSWYLIKSA